MHDSKSTDDITRIKQAYEKTREEYSIANILEKNKEVQNKKEKNDRKEEKTFIEEIIFSSICILYDNTLTYFDIEGWKDKTLNPSQDIYEQIEQYFYSSVREHPVKRCRCICGFPTSNRSSGLCVFLYVSIDDSNIDATFLNCAEKVYYKWLSELLSSIIRAVPCSSEKYFHRSIGIRSLQMKSAEIFQEYMSDVLDIDIEIITTLSSIYYEKSACRTALVFSFSDVNNLPGICFDKPIPFNRQNIKIIRKRLQMGKDNQCLLLCKNENAWEVKGLYYAEDFKNKGISFHILGHVVWKMEVRGKFSVCCKVGEYVMDDDVFKVKKLEKGFNKLFGHNPSPNMQIIFEEIIHQEHGTVLIIIQNTAGLNNNVDEEAKRIIRDSTGIKIRPTEVEKDFIISVTSIDGALIVDDTGLCYGIGMILDGSATIKGKPERGARFNSTKRYIKSCKEKDMKVMGVVLSEDGMVDVFTTNDNLDK